MSPLEEEMNLSNYLQNINFSVSILVFTLCRRASWACNSWYLPTDFIHLRESTGIVIVTAPALAFAQGFIRSSGPFEEPCFLNCHYMKLIDLRWFMQKNRLNIQQWVHDINEGYLTTKLRSTCFLLQTCRSSWSLIDNHAGTTCGRDQWYGKAVCSSTCAISGGILRETNSLGNRETRFLLIRIALEWSKSTHWFLFGIDIILGVILLSGSSNAKGIVLMVKRNLAVAHNCHSIYCLGLVVCVASLSCFVLSWIWPGWSSKQSCETWGGGYCCYC